MLGVQHEPCRKSVLHLLHLAGVEGQARMRLCAIRRTNMKRGWLQLWCQRLTPVLALFTMPRMSAPGRVRVKPQQHTLEHLLFE